MSNEGVPPPPAPPAPPPPAPSGQRNTGMLVLSYFGPLALIPLIVEKNDKEVQWHAKHGLVLFGAFLVIEVALMMLGFVLGWFVWALYWPIRLAYLVIAIVCIMKAVNGQRFLIPGISEFADKF